MRLTEGVGKLMNLNQVANINGYQITGEGGGRYQVNYMTGDALEVRAGLLRERMEALVSVYERTDWADVMMSLIDYKQGAVLVVWREKDGEM